MTLVISRDHRTGGLQTDSDWLERSDHERDWADYPTARPTPHEIAAQARLVSRPRFQRDIETLYHLGSRTVGELIAELGARNGGIDEAARIVHRYAQIDANALSRVGGDRWPNQPIHEVVG